MSEESTPPDPIPPLATRRQVLGQTLLAGAAAATVMANTKVGLAQPELAQPEFSQPKNLSVSVRQFGARGNGKGDDTRAVQSAINTVVRAGGGHVHFPAGAYRLTHALRVDSAQCIDITGDGASTTLLHENDEPVLLWPETVSCRESSVRHLRVLSTVRDKSPGTPVIACMGGVERSFFSHLLFETGGARVGGGIITRNVADTTSIEHCVMWRISGIGLQVARGSEVRILGGRIIGDGQYGSQNIGVQLTGNNGGVHIATTDLIHLHTGLKIGSAGQTSNREIFITHATFDSSIHGVWQIDNAYTSIAGCWAASCAQSQILLDSSATAALLSVAGGTIFNGGAMPGIAGAHHGLVVRAGSFNLSGVNVRYNKGIGVLVEGDAVRDYVINGCRIHNNSTGALLRGRNYVLTGNVFQANGTDLRDEGRGDKQLVGNLFQRVAGA